MIESRFDEEHGVLHLTPHGPLTADDFQAVAEEIDPFIERKGQINGLIITASQFPGWSDFSTMITHLRFVHEHHKLIRRVAIVTDDGMLSALPGIASHFVKAEVRHFAASAQQDAETWVREGRNE